MILDVLYVPTRDAAADVAFYRDALGARVVFAIEAMGTRVAEVALDPGPRLVLAEHLEDGPVFLMRVDDLDAALDGLEVEHRVELPLGPCATLRAPGGQRIGLYELKRPALFEGRMDF